MNSAKIYFDAFLLLVSFVALSRSATHDELPQCGLSGVFKMRQSIIESPNYPNKYPSSTCWDYVIRSPYRCPTKFHIQFLDFFMESSPNCTHDYLAVGLENDGDDMDILCGQVIGIKKYHTPDGILRLRFFSDDSPWTTARGFKLLITRLACEREDLLHDNLDHNDEDTVQLNAPVLQFEPPYNSLPPPFRNLTATEQYRPYPSPPLFGLNAPGQLPGPPAPTYGGFYQPQVPQGNALPAVTTQKPCVPTQTGQQQPPYNNPGWSYVSNQQTPLTPDQYITYFQSNPPQTLQRSNDPPPVTQTRQQIDGPPLGPVPTKEHCCTSSFHQKRFYLSSPGFPRTAFTSLLSTQQRDCLFQLEKNTHNVCRLRIEFKFFDFGQSYTGTGDVSGNINVAISNTHDVCTEDFLEINNERFCGCRTGFVYNTMWGLGGQTLRMRMGYSGIPSSGFLLEIFQEECHETAFVPPQLPVNGGGQQVPQNGINTPLNIQPGVPQYPVQQTIFGQPQGPIYTQQPFYVPQQQQQQQQQQQPQQQFIQQQMLQQQQQQQQHQHNQQQALLGSNMQLSPQPQQFWLPPPQFGYVPQMPQYRQSRMLDSLKAASTLQPVSVVETNSTRKEFYYIDGDETFTHVRLADEPDDPDRMDGLLTATVRDRCSFSTMDALRLTVDGLWITKPTCYAPFRNWFSNVFG